MQDQVLSSSEQAAGFRTVGADAQTKRRQFLVRVIVSNLPFVAGAVAIDAVPQFLQPLVVGAILFFSPGLAWTDHRDGNAFVVTFRVLVASLVAGLVSWLGVAALPGPTSRLGFIVVLAAITNVGLAVGWRRGWYEGEPYKDRLFRLILVVMALFYLQSYVGAAYRIPAVEDQDMETQGTSYGLIHELEPTMVTNRTTRFFFAHPLLLHFWIGTSALVYDDLDRMRYYHESSLHMLRTERPIDEARWWEYRKRWEVDFAKFERDPVLLPTRTPNLFLGVLILLPLGYLIYGLSRSALAAVGACALYATLPEIYVRSAYGGYTALTNLLTMSVAYFYLQGSGLLPGAIAKPRRLGLASGFLTAWANHKAILVPCVAAAHTGVCALLSTKDLKGLFSTKGLKGLWATARGSSALPIAVVIGLGFIAGWATFVLYGWHVNWWEFYLDHVQYHIVKRLNLRDVNLLEQRQGKWVYLSIVGIWQQFGHHTGWLFLAAAGAAMIRAAKRIREAEGFFFIWIAIGAVGFSLVDWRQTKHFAYLLPGMVVLTGLLWASLAGRARTLLGGVLVASFLWNLWAVGNLMADFNYIKPLPCW